MYFLPQKYGCQMSGIPKLTHFLMVCFQSKCNLMERFFSRQKKLKYLCAKICIYVEYLENAFKTLNLLANLGSWKKRVFRTFAFTILNAFRYFFFFDEINCAHKHKHFGMNFAVNQHNCSKQSVQTIKCVLK